MMWSSWEMSWLATLVLMTIAFGGLATLITLALHDDDAPPRQPVGQVELDRDHPSEVHDV